MVQIGLNLGARHVRVLGWAKSFTARLSNSAIKHQDQEAIGAASIAWGLMQAVIPDEIIKPIHKVLADEELPRLATQNISPGIQFIFLSIIIILT
jgi:hypothetical protein